MHRGILAESLGGLEMSVSTGAVFGWNDCLPRSAVWLKQNCGVSLGGSGVRDMTGRTGRLGGDGSVGAVEPACVVGGGEDGRFQMMPARLNTAERRVNVRLHRDNRTALTLLLVLPQTWSIHSTVLLSVDSMMLDCRMWLVRRAGGADGRRHLTPRRVPRDTDG